MATAVRPTFPRTDSLPAPTVGAPRPPRTDAVADLPDRDPAPVARAVAALRGAALALHRPLDDAEADALAVIYARYGTMMLTVARRTLDSTDDAEDVVHDVFARLHRLLCQYRGHGLGGWLRQVVRREALMLRRRAATRRESAFDDAAPVLARAADEPDDELARAITALPVALREIVVLHHFLGCSHRAIGELLDISVAASEVRLCRAVQRLRVALCAPSRAAEERAAEERAAEERDHRESFVLRPASSC